jgi:hypothetical protein
MKDQIRFRQQAIAMGQYECFVPNELAIRLTRLESRVANPSARIATFIETPAPKQVFFYYRCLV